MGDTPTVVRAFELPLQHAEKDVWPLLRECWHQSALLANWCVHQLMLHEVVRTPDMDRLPNRPPVNGKTLKGLYGLAQEAGVACSKLGCKQAGGCHWWHGASQSIASICKAVAERYDAERLDVLWRRSRSPSTYRHPHPWPVNGQSWKAAWLDAAGKPWVRLTLPGGQTELRLRGGPEFGRQMALFRQVAEGSLPRLQLVIRQQGCSAGCHRPVTPGREPSRVMVKMVARVPVREAAGQRTLTLATDPNAFWVAELDGRPAWVLNADHVARACEWLAAHEARRQRMAQDRKAERRLDVGREDAWLRSLGRCRDKHARRMSSWLHETAAHLAGFAERNRVGLVLYRDVDRGFAPLFPWHRLTTLLRDKLTAAGIACRAASDGTPEVEEVASLTPLEDEECLESMRQSATAARKLLRAASRSGSHPAVSAPSATAPTSPPRSPSTP